MCCAIMAQEQALAQIVSPATPVVIPPAMPPAAAPIVAVPPVAAPAGVVSSAPVAIAPAAPIQTPSAQAATPTAPADGNGIASLFEEEPGAAPPPVDNGGVPSLLFTEKELVYINKVIAEYDVQLAAEKSGEGSGMRPKDPNVAQFYVYPQFYLESLVYNGPEDWSIRVNGVTLTNDSPQTHELQVRSIDQTKVVLSWRPEVMARVLQVWDKVPHDLRVNVDKPASKVIFALHANQTFSSYVMRVLEGKVVPMMIDLRKPSNKVDLPFKMDDNAPAPRIVRPSDQPENNQGLHGLIGSYQRLGK